MDSYVSSAPDVISTGTFWSTGLRDWIETCSRDSLALLGYRGVTAQGCQITAR
jgi:hypothetical protein